MPTPSVLTALSVHQTEIPLVVECIDHKRNPLFPKACQGDTAELYQKVFGKTKHFARYVPPFRWAVTPLADMLADDACLNRSHPSTFIFSGLPVIG